MPFKNKCYFLLKVLNNDIQKKSVLNTENIKHENSKEINKILTWGIAATKYKLLPPIVRKIQKDIDIIELNDH